MQRHTRTHAHTRQTPVRNVSHAVVLNACRSETEAKIVIRPARLCAHARPVESRVDWSRNRTWLVIGHTITPGGPTRQSSRKSKRKLIAPCRCKWRHTQRLRQQRTKGCMTSKGAFA